MQISPLHSQPGEDVFIYDRDIYQWPHLRLWAKPFMRVVLRMNLKPLDDPFASQFILGLRRGIYMSVEFGLGINDKDASCC
jgi:hypothetical protein